MKKTLSASMVLIGTFIGAGFASGQEVFQYFGVFGNFGVAGITISCMLLGLFTYCTADNIACLGERMYVESLCKFKLVGWLLDCYMVLIYCTMITAFGECLYQVFDLPKIYGVILINVVTIIILYFGADGVVKLNAFVTPLIIIGIVFAFLTNNTVKVFSYNNFVTSAVIYTSYNVISVPFVMVGIKNMICEGKNAVACSVAFSGIIFLLALCILKLLRFGGSTSSIPLLDAVSGIYAYGFLFILAMSMLTTAVANGYGFVNAVSLNKKIPLFCLGTSGLLFSLFSFSFIVRYLYSFFGYMGLYILFINFYIFLKNREKPRKIEINNNKA